jgi:hypothetical protein
MNERLEPNEYRKLDIILDNIKAGALTLLTIIAIIFVLVKTGFFEQRMP